MTSGGGGGGGAPSRFPSTHLPRSTGDVRFGYEVTVNRLAWPSSPCAVVLGRAERDAAESLAVDARDAVVAGQPLVDEGVIRVQQIDHAAIRRKLAVDEELGLAAHRVAQVLVELVEDVGVGRVLADVAQLEPLAGEILDECAPRSRVVETDGAPAARGRRAR